MGEAKRRRQLDPSYGKRRNLTKPERAALTTEIEQLREYAKGSEVIWDTFEPSGLQPVGAILEAVTIRKRALKTLLNVHFPYLDWDDPETWKLWFFSLSERGEAKGLDPFYLKWQQIKDGIEAQERESCPG